MRIERVGKADKGWLVGPWNSSVPVSIGWANKGIDEPHHHESMNEIYMVARGTSTAIVSGQRLDLAAGDCLVVEPGESHTFVSSSPDYLHFVLHAPFVEDDKVLD